MMRRDGWQSTAGSLVLAAVLAMMAGCSSFERQWNKAPGDQHAQADPLAGRWHGQWISESTGHSGPMRCLIMPQADGRYQVTVQAERWGLLTRQTSWLITPSQHNRVYHFRTDAGDYRYEGQVVGQRFEAYYFRTAEDYGRFELTRLD